MEEGKPMAVTRKTHLEQVRDFMVTFKQEVNDLPTVSDFETRRLRYNLIEEELTELWDAFKNRDLVKIADALVDLEFVVLGGFVAFGLADLHEALFQEVQRSNMTKAWEDGTVHYNTLGKVIKGPNYSPPNLRKILGMED